MKTHESTFPCSIGDRVRSRLTGVFGTVVGLHVSASGEKVLVGTADGREVWIDAEHAIAGPPLDWDAPPREPV